MSTQRYSVTPHPIETLLTWVKSGEIAIPEIQRPFVWEATKVRNLLDSLYQGYPVGYLIAWRNSTVRLKDGTLSAGKRILIDGQQRVTALMAALLGREVLTKDYETVRIRIAFHPGEGRFEVTNPAIQKDPAWIPDVSDLFSPNAKLLQITKAYATANPGLDEDLLGGFEQKEEKARHPVKRPKRILRGRRLPEGPRVNAPPSYLDDPCLSHSLESSSSVSSNSDPNSSTSSEDLCSLPSANFLRSGSIQAW
jgi:uncharacterized protein with ParB-like and HNH nuclease domain